MKVTARIKEIFMPHKVLAIAFCLTLLASTFAYGADDVKEREYDQAQHNVPVKSSVGSGTLCCA